jgi:two-component system, NtrC family, nitrogen regulation response regulator GlnG
MTRATILVADDDRTIRAVIAEALGRQGYDVRAAGDAATLWQWVKAGEGDLVITDVLMPDGNGLDLVPQIARHRPNLRVIAMSAQSTLGTALRAAESGVFDYLPKPFDLDDLVRLVDRALAKPGSVPVAANGEADDTIPLIGRSPAMQDIYRLVAKLVQTDLTVLITGESGTGKELVARALHQYGGRRRGPFVAINMAAIPRELIESELFGHERGAFTGATVRATGRFEQAEGGTLFLDEIGDMPPEAQTRLLRVLQEGEFTTVGGRTPIAADVRIVAATHRDLQQLIRRGQFREDLFYRLNVVPIRIPPLRERREDIPDLVRHFLLQAEADGLPVKRFDAAALERLKTHDWPGNVRELENLVRRLAALYGEEIIGQALVERELAGARPVAAADDEATPRRESLASAAERHIRSYFAAHDDRLPARGLYDRIVREVERPLIAVTLEATRGNQLRAAELLGLNRNTLRKKIKELAIPVLRGLK